MVEGQANTVSFALAEQGRLGLGEGSVVGTIPVNLRDRDLGLVKRTVVKEKLSPGDAILHLIKDVKDERMMVHLKPMTCKKNYQGGVWLHLGPLIQKFNAPGPEGASQRISSTTDLSNLFQIIKYGGLDIRDVDRDVVILDVEKGGELDQAADKFCQGKGFVKASRTFEQRLGRRPWLEGLYVLPGDDTPDLCFPV